MSATEGELPKYKCHKEVWALKIKAIDHPTEHAHAGAFLIPEEDGYSSVFVDNEYLAKHNPQVGGYFVVYKDGYRSFSPAEAFEDGYTLIE